MDEDASTSACWTKLNEPLDYLARGSESEVFAVEGRSLLHVPRINDDGTERRVHDVGRCAGGECFSKHNAVTIWRGDAEFA